MKRPRKRVRPFGDYPSSAAATALVRHRRDLHEINGFSITSAIKIARSGRAESRTLDRVHGALAQWAADTGTALHHRTNIFEILEDALREGRLGAGARGVMETMPRTFAALLADFPRTEAAEEARAG